MAIDLHLYLPSAGAARQSQGVHLLHVEQLAISKTSIDDSSFLARIARCSVLEVPFRSAKSTPPYEVSYVAPTAPWPLAEPACRNLR
jgi:hypothetical protein